MILTQTAALFVDAYRELNARRLFWITLAISALIVLIFAAVGINDAGFTIFWKRFPSDQINSRLIDRATAYKTLFESLGVGWWLTFGATLLALVSTASLFPDFLTGGSIDLYLSKPIGRVRLFLTKYLAGLLFVTLQVAAFCVASFVVLGARGGVWIPEIFIAVPLVVLFFSYLYSVQVFLGVVTRSAIAALLLTIVFWAATVIAHYTEQGLLHLSVTRQIGQQDTDRQIARYQASIDSLKKAGAREPGTAPAGGMSFNDRTLQIDQTSLTQLRHDRPALIDAFASWHRAARIVDLPLPKTTQTADLIERVIGRHLRLHHPRSADRQEADGNESNLEREDFRHRVDLMREAEERTQRIEDSRSSVEIIGTSVAFECVLIAFACVLFVRRDF